MSRPLHRYALGLWFCALAALGGLRYGAVALRDPQRLARVDAQLWLYGSLALAALGLLLLLRAYLAGRRRG